MRPRHRRRRTPDCASGGHGEIVSDPKQLMPALEKALKIVKEEKRQAVLNVCLEASYVKTS